MAHNISSVIVDGKKINEAAFALRPAWHNLGIVSNDAMTSEEAINNAHLNWKVELAPVFDDGRNTRFFLTRRTDNNHVLGCGLTERYVPLQNVDAFKFMDECNDMGMKYESAFALGGGEKVVVLARFPEVDTVVEGDNMARYLALYTSHDGSGRVTVWSTYVRIICQNTLTMALKSKDNGISVKHTTNMSARMHEGKAILLSADHAFGQALEKSRALAAKRISNSDFTNYIDALYPVKESKTERGNKATATRRENLVNSLIKAYKEETTNNLDSMTQTAWAAFNAVTFNVDHNGQQRVSEGTNEDEARFDNIMTGTGAKTKQQAFDLAVKMFA